MIVLYVKKLSSLEPKRFTYIDIADAIRGYEDYVLTTKHEYKTFDQWLSTEPAIDIISDIE